MLAPKCVSGFSINFFLRVSFLIDRSLRRRRRKGKEERKGGEGRREGGEGRREGGEGRRERGEGTLTAQIII